MIEDIEEEQQSPQQRPKRNPLIRISQENSAVREKEAPPTSMSRIQLFNSGQ